MNHAPVNTHLKAFSELHDGKLAVGIFKDSPTDAFASFESFITSNTLPAESNPYSTPHFRMVLESAGMRFLEEVPGDPMFQFVVLPSGWKKERGVGNSVLLKDTKGRIRARISYIAEFYKRQAHINLVRRFVCVDDDEQYDKNKMLVRSVVDNANNRKIIFTTNPRHAPEGVDYCSVFDAVQNELVTWLNEHYPDWENPGAYWE